MDVSRFKCRSWDWLPTCFDKGLFVLVDPLNLIHDFGSCISGRCLEITVFIEIFGCIYLGFQYVCTLGQLVMKGEFL